MTDKSQLRASIRARRAAFVAALAPAERARCHTALPSPLARLIGPGRCVAAYRAKGAEADPANLLMRAAELGAATALAWTGAPVQPLRFLGWSPGEPLEIGPYGIEQPPGDRPVVRPDIILVPLLAFDAALNRLGQGAGYYDRTLAAHDAALAVGIAWSVQQVDEVPVDAWDRPLDAVITEKSWICA